MEKSKAKAATRLLPNDFALDKVCQRRCETALIAFPVSEVTAAQLVHVQCVFENGFLEDLIQPWPYQFLLVSL